MFESIDELIAEFGEAKVLRMLFLATRMAMYERDCKRLQAELETVDMAKLEEMVKSYKPGKR